jgi:hypothetical protein
MIHAFICIYFSLYPHWDTHRPIVEPAIINRKEAFLHHHTGVAFNSGSSLEFKNLKSQCFLDGSQSLIHPPCLLEITKADV